MWPQLGVTAVGIWLMAAPAVLGYGGAAAASDRIVGPTVAAIGFVAASAITRGLRWLNLIPAVWLLVGPWLLGAPVPAKASSITAGLLVLALARSGRPDPGRFGGGWRSLAGPGPSSLD
jgi:hypothetical protein